VAETEYHIPFPKPATETKQSRRETGWEVFEEGPIDWNSVDQLLILMSLSIAERTLRKVKRTNMDPEIRILLLDRLRQLVEIHRKLWEDPP